MPSKKSLLKDDIEMRWKILITVKEVLKFAAYFQQPATRLEQYYIRRQRHLTFINLALWRLTIIELCKLFGDSENQKYNIMKLLRKFDYNGDFRSLKFDKEILTGFNDLVNQLQPIIIEIVKLRNTLYAHTDSDPFVHIETIIEIKDCFNLVEFAEEVIRTLAGRYLDTDYIANTLYFDSQNFDFIHILAKQEQDENIAIAQQHGMSFKELFGYDPLS